MKLPKGRGQKTLLFWFVWPTMGPFCGVSGQCGATQGEGKSEPSSDGTWSREDEGGTGGRSLTGSNPDLFFQLLGFEFHFNQMQMGPEPQESQCLAFDLWSLALAACTMGGIPEGGFAGVRGSVRTSLCSAPLGKYQALHPRNKTNQNTPRLFFSSCCFLGCDGSV